MFTSLSSVRPTFITACVLAASWASVANAAEPARIVFQNGKSIPINSVIPQGDKLIVKTTFEGFQEKQVLPLATADHIYGEKPAEINQALAILLLDKEKAKEVQKMLDPIIAEHRFTAKIPGNFWLEAAKIQLVACAVDADAGTIANLGKEISDATSAQGIDPFVSLGKALLISPLAKLEERDAALRDQTTDNLPADVCAFASFFRGELFKKEKKDSQALGAYLAVTCLYPSGGLILNAASEIKAADLLAAAGKREDALALVTSALRSSAGTVLVQEANKRLESLK